MNPWLVVVDIPERGPRHPAARVLGKLCDTRPEAEEEAQRRRDLAGPGWDGRVRVFELLDPNELRLG